MGGLWGQDVVVPVVQARIMAARDAGMRARTFLKVIVVSVVVPGGVD